jgi:hypothetical protein
MPIVYFAALLAAGALCYSHVSEVASELGAKGAPYAFATALNTALIVVGLTGLAGSFGLASGLQKLGVGKFLSIATGLTLAITAVSFAMSGIFPLPSPYHSSMVLLIIGNLTPLLAGLSFRKLDNSTAITLALYGAFFFAIAVVAVILGLGNFITDDNVGLWLRIWAAVLLPTVSLLYIVVSRRLPVGTTQ